MNRPRSGAPRLGSSGDVEYERGGNSVWRQAVRVYYDHVDAPGTALRAGVQVGDVITHIEGQAVTSDAGAKLLSSIAAEHTYRLQAQRGDTYSAR